MRALIVTGGEFAALHFANQFHGTPVAEIIEHLDRFQSEADMNEDAEFIELEVVEAGEVSRGFISRLREMADYDHSKQSNFYMEYEELS